MPEGMVEDEGEPFVFQIGGEQLDILGLIRDFADFAVLVPG